MLPKMIERVNGISKVFREVGEKNPKGCMKTGKIQSSQSNPWYKGNSM